MRGIAALIVAAIAAAGWLASQRSVALERASPVHRVAILPTDYQRCATVRPGPLGRRGKIVIPSNNSEIV
jgi:hypothetical protein